MFYGSGNRDERLFADPWRLDMTRHRTRTLPSVVGAPTSASGQGSPEHSSDRCSANSPSKSTGSNAVNLTVLRARS